MKFKPDDKVTMNVKTIEVTQNSIHESVKEVQMSSNDYKKELDTVIHVEVLHASLEGYFIEKLHIDKDNLFGCIVYNTKNSIITILVYTIVEDYQINKEVVVDNAKNKTCFADSITVEAKAEKDDPNSRYEDKCIGVWNTKEDVDAFFKEHTYANNWKGLSVGNYVKINDGTYNKDWVIAGFDCEKASDGTPGGIVFIPRYVNLTTNAWHSSASSATPYNYSDIHTYINNKVYDNLSNILGDHIVKRNVTLGSECSSTSPREWTTSKTTNTTAYLTLMSVYQKMGFSAYYNSKDDGEADYKLPLFNFIDNNTYAGGTIFWLRNVYGMYSSGGGIFRAYGVFSNRSVSHYHVNLTYGVRPLMYLR